MGLTQDLGAKWATLGKSKSTPSQVPSAKFNIQKKTKDLYSCFVNCTCSI